MNILLINSYSTGGAGKACIRLCKAFDKNTVFSVNVLFKISENKKFPQLIFEPRKIQNLLRPSHLIRHRKLVKLRKENLELLHKTEIFNFPIHPEDILEHPLYKKADLINLHWVSNLLDYSSFFKKNKKPLVWTLHDMEAFTGGYHYEIDNFKSHQDIIQENLNVKITACSNKKIHVVSPSKWLLEKAKKSAVFKSSKFYHIPNAVDTNIFSDKYRSINTDQNRKPTILFVAESIKNKRKGFSILKELILKNSSKYNWIAVGDNKGLSNDSVEFTGTIHDESEMAKKYCSADLFVIPSLIDNSPNTILESLCCGTPVIGFAVGGIPELIKEGQNGLLAKELNSSNLEKTIEEALKLNFNKSLISQEARQKFALKEQEKSYSNLFSEILNH